MPHFPMFIDLKEKPVLVVGGGTVALRKVKKPMPYEPEITVIAPEISNQMLNLEKIIACKRNFADADLESRPVIVIAATDDKEENHRIAELCHERQIPVNVVDDPDNCSFLFPALVQQGKFSAGICTGGSSPTASAYYKKQLQELLPENIEEILDYLEAQREPVKQRITDGIKRARVFREMFEECIENGIPSSEEQNIQKRGSVALVGAGCGKADLITVRGLKLLQKCQVVVYDDLIDAALLDEVPESALKVYVGKRAGIHSAKQKEINQMLIDFAASGLQVVRLKGGDPYLFGRGGEEILALKAAGISCQKVPGIPSAIGIPAEAGIPVTHRGVSRGIHIVTAHTSDTEDGLPADFDALAKLEGTLVFLMGLGDLSKIVARLRKAGKGEDTPVAVISGGNAKNPKTVRGTFATIEEDVKKANVEAPAIILAGKVAEMNLSI